jgi:hypothetical protein
MSRDKIDLGGEPWQAIPKATLRDPRLGAKAKGGLVTLLSHEEGWVRSAVATLQRECAIGRAQAQAIMLELRKLGYAEIVRERDLEGRIRSHYIVRAIAQKPAGSQAQTSGFPVAGQPARPETRPTDNQAAKNLEALGVRSPTALEPKPTSLPTFEDFWAVYPRKVGKKAAKAAWSRAIRDGTAPSAIVEAATAYARDPRRDPRYTAHALTWLNQGRWDDEPEVTPAPEPERAYFEGFGSDASSDLDGFAEAVAADSWRGGRGG